MAFVLQTHTGVSKALLATERDITQGKLRFLFTTPGAVVGNSRWKQILLELSDSGSHDVSKCIRILFPRTLSVNDYIIVRYFTAYNTENKRKLLRMRTQYVSGRSPVFDAILGQAPALLLRLELLPLKLKLLLLHFVLRPCELSRR